MKISKLVPRYIIGIDEVGRGALAGPVTVAAVATTVNSKIKLSDSKKLTSRQREIWFRWIKKHSNILENVRMFYAISSVSPKIIDKINVSQAANLAATRAFHKLTTRYSLNSKFCKVFLDGGLYINKSKIKNQNFKNIKTKTIIRGDEKIPAISLASIVAKVHRDKLMKKLHKKYPRYDFIHNVGYGVKKHAKAIKKYGRSPIHRRSFKVPLA